MTLVEGFRLTELAAMCGLRTSQFAHAFRHSVGISPYQWLVRRRIERAKEQIRKGVPLSEVALSCGFADQSHMNRTFKRIVGTPLSWATDRGAKHTFVSPTLSDQGMSSIPEGFDAVEGI